MELNSVAQENKKHNITLNNRKLLALDGIIEILNFDDTLISLATPLGELNIEGSELRITKYLMQSGEMCIEGVFSALIYSQERTEQKKGLFSRLMR